MSRKAVISRGESGGSFALRVLSRASKTRLRLKRLGTLLEGDGPAERTAVSVEGDLRRVAKKFLRAYRRPTALSDHLIKAKFRAAEELVGGELIPVLAEHEFIHTIHHGVGTEGRRLGGSCRVGPGTASCR